jgi:hypothetical protein
MELEWKINELQSKPNIIEYLLQPSPKQKAGIDYILN